MRHVFSIIALTATISITGCSSEGTSELELLLGDRVSSPTDGVAIERARALVAQGQPQLLVGVEEREQVAALVRVTQRGNRSTWITTDDISASFEDGVLVATRGLGFDLMAADVSQVKPLIFSRSHGRAKRFHSYLNGENQSEFDSFICDITSLGARDVSLVEKTFQTWLMAEDCAGATENFINLYWLSGDTIIQSRQWVSAGTGALQIGVVSR